MGEALAEVERVAWHLSWDGSRWRFLTEPNANAIVAEEMRNVPNSRVSSELDDLLHRTFPSDGPIRTVFFPSGPGALPDDPSLRLVVLHHDDLPVRGTSASRAPSRVVNLLDRAGMAEGIRTFRNAAVFLLADEDARAAMKEKVRASLAVRAITSDEKRLAQFSADVQKRLRSAEGTAKLEARIAINRCYRHVYHPSSDRSSDYLHHIELTPQSQGEAEKPQTRTILEALRGEGKIRETKPSTDYLRQKAWPHASGSVTTKEVAEYFWRDHSAQLLLDPTLLRDAVRDGVKNGAWVYRDVRAERTWGADGPAPAIEISGEHELWDVSEAQKALLTKRPLTWDDIDAVLSDELDGARLRAELERRLGYEPDKAEILQVLARAAEGGRSARVVVVSGSPPPTSEGLAVGALVAARLEDLTVLRPSAAQKLGIVLGDGQLRPVETTGVAGVAFQQLIDRASDVGAARGISRLSITATADPGEGPRDLSLLGKALPMLPRMKVAVAMDMVLEFAGLQPGAEVRLAGPGAEYLRIEDRLLALAASAAKVAGSLRLDIEWSEPVRPDGDDVSRIRKVITDLSPGDVRLRAELA